MDDLDTWMVNLKPAEDALSDGKLLTDLQRRLVLITLGAAVKLPDGRFMRLSGVILMTPVDTGRARKSWNVAVSTPNESVPAPGTYTTPNPNKLLSQAGRIGTYTTVWITSSLEYMGVLEYGQYPDPVQKGTWTPKGYIQKSAAGFSRQAPQGMVRVTFARVLSALGTSA